MSALCKQIKVQVQSGREVGHAGPERVSPPASRRPIGRSGRRLSIMVAETAMTNS